MLEDLSVYLDSGSTLLQVGRNLFAHAMREGSSAALLLSLESGTMDNLTYGSTLPAISTPTVVVTSRSTRPADATNPVPTTALRLSWVAYRKLSQLVDVVSTGSGRRFLAAIPTGEPGYAGQDEAGRSHFEQSWNIFHTPTTGDY